jgi:hypothetical protein
LVPLIISVPKGDLGGQVILGTIGIGAQGPFAGNGLIEDFPVPPLIKDFTWYLQNLIR